MGKIREKFLKKKLLIVGGVLGLGLFAFWIYTNNISISAYLYGNSLYKKE